MLVQVRLIDGFAVVVDGAQIPAERWVRRSAASLVQLLALAPARRLHRDRVVVTLWPDVDPVSGSRRLHKAAHHARRILGRTDAVVLRNEVVALFPDAEVVVDAAVFAAAADAALRSSSVPECVAALDRAGDLLPDGLGEAWLDEPRERFRRLRLELHRAAGRWEDVLAAEPADEQAHLALVRQALAEGQPGKALRRYADMEKLLAEELGVGPGPEAVALRRQLDAVGASTAWSAASAESDRSDALADLPGAAPFLERQRHLELLQAAARRAAEGRRGTVVLVPGEAGAGKSALVRAFLEQLAVPLLALVGGCDDLIAPRALGPFREMARRHPQVEAVLRHGEPDDLLAQLAAFLSDEPAVVVLEDVHWADDATLDVIRYLARRIVTMPTLLVLTFRDEGLALDHPLQRVLGGLSGTPVSRLNLPPLSVEALMLLGAGSEQEAAEIHRVTHGNPFFSTEVLASTGSGVPATVRDAVLARMSVLGDPVRELLRRLSVVPTRIERWLAEAVAVDAEDVLFAERSGMLAGDTSALWFRHELARQAVESSLTAGERVRANATVVHALLHATPVDSTRLVHHAERAGMTQVLREHGPVAAEEAARLGSHRQAAEILRVVLAHPGDLPDSRRADLLTRRAYSLYLVNQYERALREAEQAVEIATGAGSSTVLGDGLVVLARVAYFARGPLRARQAARRAVETLRGTGASAPHAAALAELARAHSNLAMVGIVGERCDLAEEPALEAAQIASALNRSDLLAQALCYLGDARLSMGDPEGAGILDRAISLAESDSRVETRVRCLVNAAGGAYRTGRFADAERYVEEGLRLAADVEFFAGEYRLRLTRAAVRSSAGRWDESIAELSSLVLGEGEPGMMAPLAGSLLARLQARRGDPAASDTLSAAAQKWAGCDDPFIAAPLCVASVELGWLDGSLAELTAEAGRVLSLLERCGPRSLHAELVAYLGRLGVRVPGPEQPPGPWRQTLEGDWRGAAGGWERLGDRYERALVLAAAPDAEARRAGTSILEDLGATAVLPAL